MELGSEETKSELTESELLYRLKREYMSGIAIGVAFVIVIGLVGALFLRHEGFFLARKTGGDDTAVNAETIEKMKLLESAIGSYYYKAEVDRDKEADGIYKGIVNSLEDPYSVYYTEDEYKQLIADNKGVYYGIGAYVSMDKDSKLPVITGTIADSPAEKAGFMANDVIYKVDGESVAGLELSDVVDLIKGDEGTEVTVTVYRDGEDDYLDIPVTRGEVKAQTVSTTMLENDIGYLGITEFDAVTPSQFEEGMNNLREQNMKALIVDLRSNPGGNLSAVVEIAGSILPEGEIVYTLDRDGERADYKGDGLTPIDIPLVVLVNGYSASASEIFAGAVKDYGIGTIVGEQTYGKGVVQRIFGLGDGTAVKLTISDYYTPSGNNINGVGIEPDVEVVLDYKEYKESGKDNQLDKAVEILKEELKSASKDAA